MHTKIKTFEDACIKLGVDPEKVLPDFSMFPKQHQKAMTAHAKLIIIADALNGDWKPDWENGEWDKYYPWFAMGSPSGSGFSFGAAANWTTGSDAGSRLCFQSSEIAEYVGRQFEDLYKDYFVMN